MKRREILIGAVSGAAGVAALAATGTNSALAQTPSATTGGGGALDRIIKEKKIRVHGGSDVAAVRHPRQGQPARRLGDRDRAAARQGLGVELELVQVTAPQRIPALLAGRADVAISSLSITLDRAKTVMFAPPHGALSIVIAARRTSRSATRTTWRQEDRPHARHARGSDGAQDRAAGTQIVMFDDIAATMQAMVSGQVDAAGMSAFAAKSVADRNPRANLENKFTVTTAFYAAAIRPGDFDLLQFMRTWVFLNKQNGTLAAIYQKYTQVPLVELPVL
jgi:polar amino acid transport system substrate-binding protein